MRLCSLLLFTFAFVSLHTLAAETNVRLKYIPAKYLEADAAIPVQERQPMVFVVATNTRKYISGWDPECHCFALTEVLIIGSMRHVDIVHGAGLGHDFAFADKKVRGWVSYGNNRVDGEGKKIVVVAFEYHF